jgi:hypothetical protein
MSVDLCRMMVEDFLKNSFPCVETIAKEISASQKQQGRNAALYDFKNGQKHDLVVGKEHFFLRCSVEYSNPQLTVEEVQGIIAVRFLEITGNYFSQYGLHETNPKDIEEICEALKKPWQGKVVSFLLNTDDIEPDRYSMNPLKESIVNSGQSALPSATVRTDKLEIDQKFAEKYQDSLICSGEIDRITRHLQTCRGSYMDMVDAVKYEHLENLSQRFGIDLCIPSMRMPLAILEKESTDGLLHHIIRETHKDFGSFESIYKCMGRSTKNLTTLLTVPHSSKGYGSKRAARGRVYFDGSKLKNAKVDYKTVLLYPNAIDPADVSVAKADDSFTVEGEKLSNYNFKETPSSPQFFLYSLASPEDAVVWHGIGAFGASELLKSYTTTRAFCARNSLISGLKEKYEVSTNTPMQFNLVPKYMWFHPKYRNIDASIGCIQNLKDLADLGIRMENLPFEQYIRK